MTKLRTLAAIAALIPLTASAAFAQTPGDGTNIYNPRNNTYQATPFYYYPDGYERNFGDTGVPFYQGRSAYRDFYSCPQLCDTDTSPCDPPQYKATDGRCNVGGFNSR